MTASLLETFSCLSHLDFLVGGGGSMSSAGLMPDEGTEAEGGWVLKKSTKDWASIVAEEIMTRREGRTRRILMRIKGVRER